MSNPRPPWQHGNQNRRGNQRQSNNNPNHNPNPNNRHGGANQYGTANYGTRDPELEAWRNTYGPGTSGPMVPYGQQVSIQ